MISVLKTTGKLLKMLAFMLPLLCLARPASASHFAAADLYVTYIGAGVDPCNGTIDYKYKIVLDIYKACEGGSAGLGTSETLYIQSLNSGDLTTTIPNEITRPNNGPNGYAQTTFQPWGKGVTLSIGDNPESYIDTLARLCPGIVSSCREASQSAPDRPGFILHRYTLYWDAPSPQTDWKFSWTNGARNSAIVNLSTKGSIYIEAGLNNLAKHNNSTPHFRTEAIQYLCINRPATYLNDLEKTPDSLHVYPHVSYSGAGVQDVFAPGYTLVNPIAASSSDPYLVDPVSGTATFTPTQVGKFVLAFQCDKYERNSGTLLSYTMRDVQIGVLACKNEPPTVDSISSSISPPFRTSRRISTRQRSLTAPAHGTGSCSMLE